MQERRRGTEKYSGRPFPFIPNHYHGSDDWRILMKQCKSCLTRAEATADICPVCGIDQDKARRDLTKKEKRIRRSARGIRFVAMFHLILAAIAVMMMPEFPAPAAIAVLAVINGLLAYGLVRYSLLAYKAATVYYFLIGMVNVISIQRGAVHMGAVVLVLTALYLVGNGTSKAIFDRRFPEPD
jgi:hypothetical protein